MSSVEETTNRGTTFIISLFVLILVLYVYYFLSQSSSKEYQVISGYSLFSVLIFLSLFGLKKKFSSLPKFGKSYWWHQVHIVLGIASVFLFFMHIDTVEFQQPYEKLLLVFYFSSIFSGIFGWFIQSYYPKKLTEKGDEVIFDRIPEMVFSLQSSAKKLVKKSIKEEQSEVILNLYQSYIHHYFDRPKFTFAFFFKAHSYEFMMKNQFSTFNRYCNKNELLILNDLKKLTLIKMNIDYQYFYQYFLKIWLFVHVPSVTGLMLLSFFHLFLMNNHL